MIFFAFKMIRSLQSFWMIVFIVSVGKLATKIKVNIEMLGQNFSILGYLKGLHDYSWWIYNDILIRMV